MLALNLKNVVPIVGLIAGYKAVVGERESGSLRILLGMPTTRRDVVLGKFLGRVAVVGVALFVAMVGLAVVLLTQFEGLAGPQSLAIVALVFLYGFSWAGLAVGVSAGASTRFRAMAIVFGLYTMFAIFWQALVLPLFAMLFTGSPDTSGLEPIALAEGPSWYLYVQRLNPVEAYEGARIYVPFLFDPGFTGTLQHAPNLFGVAMLVSWAVVPLVVGYWRFGRSDLG
ncbi:ABC transporter permease subunit [Haloarchaeobius sp. DYHT-AS-18]|uniref:ABC transporter permease subunit n=1 Tax=Haloarchaeobius sp. DYHT-AS-18 TaxID=3446117 RepID=UPI003EBC7A6F